MKCPSKPLKVGKMCEQVSHREMETSGKHETTSVGEEPTVSHQAGRGMGHGEGSGGSALKAHMPLANCVTSRGTWYCMYGDTGPDVTRKALHPEHPQGLPGMQTQSQTTWAAAPPPGLGQPACACRCTKATSRGNGGCRNSPPGSCGPSCLRG